MFDILISQAWQFVCSDLMGLLTGTDFSTASYPLVFHLLVSPESPAQRRLVWSTKKKKKNGQECKVTFENVVKIIRKCYVG